uniref:Cryptochrome-2 n=1 Tax=Cacopsylla melanoneura TaxID=428564 RepID=A0A8D8QV99_9HEMI
MGTNPECAVHWIRKGMRLHDNPALLAAINFKNDQGKNILLKPLYILDPHFRKFMRVGPNRWRFLQQSLADLDEKFRALGLRLYIVRGKPEEVFPDLFKTWNIKQLTWEYDIEPYAKKRDALIEEMAKQYKVKVEQHVSHTLYNTNLVLKANGGKAPMTYQKLVSVLESLPTPKPPLDAPTSLPKECQGVFHAEEHLVPSMSEMGLDETTIPPCKFFGGETEALTRLNKSLANKEWVRKFEKPNTAPNSLEPSTTVLSPYLKFGCLSVRLFYHELKKILATGPHAKPPVSLLGQIYWREFYYVVGSDTDNFDKMKGNKICCQVDWDTNEKYLEAWAHGKTGYPFIDAIMRQLRQEGWIHHLARHAVACFLTRGDLYLSWEDGQGVFEELLLDADWAMNAGNWMWLSASAFFHQFFRVYSPVAFGKKTDKFGTYIKKYVPELAKYPVEYIYSPWEAPLSVQKTAGCVIGLNYPRRIVNHEEIHKKNIARLSAAYKRNKANNAASTSSSPAKKSPKSSPAESKAKRKSTTQTTLSFSKKKKE